MDFSKRYIKICERAEELQRKWKCELGDFCYRKNSGKIEIITAVRQIGWWKTTPIKLNEMGYSEESTILAGDSTWDAIWLPTQDQLQEMCDPPLDILLMEFWKWLPHEEVAIKYTSMEQLWLAYLMWELYGKVWDDEKEDWVKQEVQDEILEDTVKDKKTS